MASTPRMPREQRRAQLLELATKLFTERGFQGTSMDDIASAAGVTKPVLYQHFSSKEELYGVVIEITGKRLLNSVAALGTIPGSTAERVRHGIAKFYDVVRLDNTLRLFTGHETISPDVQQRVSEILDQGSVALANVLTDSRQIDHEQARVLGRAIIGLTQAAAVMLDESDSLEQRHQIFTVTTSLIVRGLTGFAPLDEPRVAGEVSPG